MEITVGVRDTGSGSHADVVLRAPAGTRLAAVLDQLAAVVLGAAAAGPVRAAGREVPPETLLGAPPLVHGAVLEFGLCAGTSSAAQHRQARDCPTLRVVNGPHTGRLLPLTGGDVTVGRDPDCELVLDEVQVSRRHVRMAQVAADPDQPPTAAAGDRSPALRVTDLGSTNGTSLDAQVVDTGLLTPGRLLRVGASTLTVEPPAGAPVPLTPTGDGRLAYARPPRVRQDAPVVQVVVPHPPAAGERPSVPLLALLGPLVLGVVMWRVTGALTFLLFTLLSPVLVLGQLVTERRSGRRRSRRDRALWQAQRRTAEATLRQAVAEDERRRRAANPDCAALLLESCGPGERLWERRRGDDDLLHLRLGLADQPARVEAEGDLAGLRTQARAVPLVVALPEVGALGVTGPEAVGLARSLVLHAASTASPRDLQIVVLSADAGPTPWAWARWLPHTRPDRGQDCRALLGLGQVQAAARVAELDALLDDRAAAASASGGSRRVPDGPAVLIVVDGARALRPVPGLRRLLAEGPAYGITALCLDEPDALPEECRATAHADRDVLRVRSHGRPDLVGTPDLLSAELAETAARALAPLRDTSRDRGGQDGLPAQVRWTEQVGLTLDDGPGGVADGARQVGERWLTRGGTRVLLGRGPEGPFTLDLVADGPHALVAGTTGSGKSELLQTLVASLALAHRPDALTFVLVDYKGGAAFGPCAQLPHTAGLVTDLDPTLVERALTSLRAELTRREQVLESVGAKDIDEHRARAPVGQGLARLVIVVDEFASLAEELPDFVAGLVGISQRGRSLGVHLVLATQRPEGVVSPEIRANTNLRLCLAVTAEHESRDVIDSSLAARLSRATPGRGLARTGPSCLTAFQAARVGGPRAVSHDPALTTVAVCPTAEVGDPMPTPAGGTREDPTGGGAAASDLDLFVAACARAAVDLGIAPVTAPWLPPLPETLTRRPSSDVRRDGAPDAGITLSYGLVDVPAQQAQRPLRLELERAGHLLVLGAPRSGRTTLLRTLAAAVTEVAVDDLHLYVIDAGGALGALGALPHTGAVVGRAEPDRVARLLQWLDEELADRRKLLAAGGFASLAEQRAASGPSNRLPHLLLMLDRWEAFLAAFQDLDAGRFVDLVLTLLQDGPGAGLHVVVTADRSGLIGRIGSLIDTRLLLRMADPGDYAAAGVPAAMVPDHLPAGRGWLLDGAPLAGQVALLDTADPLGPPACTDSSGAAQSTALTRLAAAAPDPRQHRPHRIVALPTSVHRDALTCPPPGPGLLLGVGGDGAAPLVVDPDRTGVLLVAGPPGSGRSTTLLTLAVGARAQGRQVVVVTPRPSALRALADTVWLSGDEAPAELESRLHRTGDPARPTVLLLDDVELLTDSTLAPALERAVAAARDGPVVVLAAGTTSDLVSAYRGLPAELRRSRTGVLLHPAAALDGDLFGVRLTAGELAGTGPPPGRGLVVGAGRCTPVQVACSAPGAAHGRTAPDGRTHLPDQG